MNKKASRCILTKDYYTPTEKDLPLLQKLIFKLEQKDEFEYFLDEVDPKSIICVIYYFFK